jgi:hypothetical protein
VVSSDPSRPNRTCQTLLDTGSGQALLVFTAAPGSQSHDRLALLSVIGRQLLDGPSR